jgi:hypothetical protein
MDKLDLEKHSPWRDININQMIREFNYLELMKKVLKILV